VVLTALAMYANEAVSGERLADALWGDDVPASWNKVVQGCVVRLRKALGSDAIETVAGGYRLRLIPDDIDIRRFERLLVKARQLFELGQYERAVAEATAALEAWKGPPFADVEDWEPAQIEARRLDELRLEAEELHVDAALRAGRHREVLSTARALAAAAPTRERRWELLALAAYRAGGQGNALRMLHEARMVLRHELGLDPGPALIALERAVLEEHPDLVAPSPLPDLSTSAPWPGLPAYDVGDADQFFGRDDALAECLRRLHSEGVVVVVGASGSGKSSLVRAGLAATLLREGHRVVVLTPGPDRPADAVVEAGGGAPVVLVIDQCEEAITACPDPHEQRAFFDALVAHAERAPLVVAIRADRVADVTANAAFARLVERGLFLLGPMGEEGIRAAIEGPARRAGALLEPGLVDLVVRDVVHEPGALPLMSHALRQTWEGRQGRTLTVAAYRETGGISGAVARSADAVYDDLDPALRLQLRELLVRLVGPTDSGDPVRVRVPRRALAGHAGYEQLVEHLLDARLLTSDDEVVEIAHESLIRAWPRLREWLDVDLEGQQALRHLARAAADWDALGRPHTELYRGLRLARATEWQFRTAQDLTSIERIFLDASVASEASDLRAARAQVARERRSVRQLRVLVAVVSLLLAAAVVASSLAIQQRDRAGKTARIAEARRVAAEALVATPYDRALLLAVEAVRLWDSAETRGSLLTTIGRGAGVSGIIRGGEAAPVGIDVATPGDRMVVADGSGVLALYRRGSRQRLATLRRAGVRYASPAFSPDGRQIAVATSSASCAFSGPCDADVEIFTGDDLAPSGTTYRGFAHEPADLAFSRDGTLIAAAAPFATDPAADNLAIWRTDSPGAPWRRLTLDTRGIDLRAAPGTGPRSWVAFSPDGMELYAGGAGPVGAFDVATGQLRRTFDGLGALALSPDGRTLAIAEDKQRIALVDTATGARRSILQGHSDLVTAAAFSPDGRELATASSDETAAVWNSATGERLRTLAGHSGAVLALVFSPDGSTLYTSATDRSVFAWTLDRPSGLARPLAAPSLDPSAESVVLISPTVDSVAVITDGIRIVDLRSGRALDVANLAGSIAWAAYSADGQRLATVGFDGATTVWRVVDGARLASKPGRGTENFGAIAFAGHGKTIVVADSDGSVHQLDGATLDPVGRPISVGVVPSGVRTGGVATFAVTGTTLETGGTDIVFGSFSGRRAPSRVHVPVVEPRANFSADGRRYAVGGFDGRVGVVDVATGKFTGPGDPAHAGPVAWVAFSPDGLTLASVGFDGEVVLADAATATPRAHVRPGGASRHAAIAFAPDGRSVVVAYRDGSALEYDTDPDAWVAHACRVAGRNLSAAEWRDTFGNEPRRETCVPR
jgi:WD40 repeat protein/DNA-binding SARP family transcriptional activator